MTTALSSPRPQVAFDLGMIPDATRAEAQRLEEERHAEWTAYHGPARRFGHLPAVMALESRACALLRELTALLYGADADPDALGETREVLAEDISATEALDVLCNYPDAAGVPAWLAAAAAYAVEE